MRDQSYNLNGLRVVYWGMLFGIIAGLGTGGMGWLRTKFASQYIEYVGYGFTALTMLGFLMIIVGLSLVGKYSHHFRRSRNYYIWSVLLVVIAVALFVVAYWFVDRKQDSSGTMLGTVGMIIAAVVFILLAGWLDILKIKQMMNGCADIARQNDERKYASRCTRAWFYYLLFVLLSLVLMVILAVVAIKSLLTTADATGGNITSVEQMTGGFQYFYNCVIALGASLILLFISYLLVMGKVNGILMRYHKVEIPLDVYEDEEEYIPAPPVEAEELEPEELEEPEVPVPPVMPARASEPAPTASAPTVSEPIAPAPVAPAMATAVQAPATTEVPARSVVSNSASARREAETGDGMKPEAAAEPSTPAVNPLVETSATFEDSHSPAPSPVKQAGGKHAKPSGFMKQASSKHAAPRKVQDRPAAASATSTSSVASTSSSAPAASAVPSAPEFLRKEREAETRTIEMPKNLQELSEEQAEPELFEEGMEPKGFGEE